MEWAKGLAHTALQHLWEMGSKGEFGFIPKNTLKSMHIRSYQKLPENAHYEKKFMDFNTSHAKIHSKLFSLSLT